MSENALFTVGQKAFIIHDQKLLVMTSEEYGIDLPGGRIQEGELDFGQSLKREVKEETGLDIKIQNPYWTWYFQTKEQVPIFCIGYLCSIEKNIIVLGEEHDGFEWVDKTSYKKVIKRTDIYDIDVQILEKLFLDTDLFH
jgi:8-oxo-dGTP diphosphatase